MGAGARNLKEMYIQHSTFSFTKTGKGGREKKTGKKTEERVQSRKCLPCKHEDPEFDQNS